VTAAAPSETPKVPAKATFDVELVPRQPAEANPLLPAELEFYKQYVWSLNPHLTFERRSIGCAASSTGWRPSRRAGSSTRSPPTPSSYPAAFSIVSRSNCAARHCAYLGRFSAGPPAGLRLPEAAGAQDERGAKVSRWRDRHSPRDKRGLSREG